MRVTDFIYSKISRKRVKKLFIQREKNIIKINEYKLHHKWKYLNHKIYVYKYEDIVYNIY